MLRCQKNPPTKKTLKPKLLKSPKLTMLNLLLLIPGTARALQLATPPSLSLKDVGTQPFEWDLIGFQFRETRSFLHYKFRDGEWDEGTEMDGSEPYVPVHIGATALHYGQSLFEGLKAFHCADGQVRLFRPKENAKRMQRGSYRTLMEPPPDDLFIEACKRVVRANLDYVPPYGSGGALYVRPLLFGSGARIGLQASDTYDFLVMCTPVGAYYKQTFGRKKDAGLKAMSARVVDDFDRAAPQGVGAIKVAGNYAADMQPNLFSRNDGFPLPLYLDAATRTYVEEFSTSNLFGIDKEGNYVTPDSDAILPSITNDSLMQIATDILGLKAERRPVTFDELEHFREVAACGTAVVVTPVDLLRREPETNFLYVKYPVCTKLYNEITAIQYGDGDDIFDWMVDVDV